MQDAKILSNPYRRRQLYFVITIGLVALVGLRFYILPSLLQESVQSVGVIVR